MTTADEVKRLSLTEDNERMKAWREIGQRLQNLRARLDEPFALVAARAEIKPTDLAAIERGEIEPNCKSFQALLDALKVTSIDFVCDLSSPSRLLLMELFKPKLITPPGESEDSVLMRKPSNEVLSAMDNGDLAKDPPRASVYIKRSRDAWGIAREPGQITYYQMHACLRGIFKRTDREKAEVIYSWTSPADIDVKVFTSVDARTGLARPLGEDAIRIVAYDKRAKRKIVSWSTELRRIGRWQLRLREKVGAAILHASYRPRCPVCRQETMIIYGRPEMQFWGCSSYPRCRGTSDLGGEGKLTTHSAPIPT
jgi:transcriptional regulator with XRE-family HTH domain